MVSAVVGRIELAAEEFELDLGSDRRTARSFLRYPSCHRRTFPNDENDSTLFVVRSFWCPVLSNFPTSNSSHHRLSRHWLSLLPFLESPSHRPAPPIQHRYRSGNIFSLLVSQEQRA